MAVTQNTYTGNGSTALFSFTFPYLDESDIQVEVNGTPTTAYTLANATTIQFTSAPASGASIRIFRVTNDSQLQAEFFPGSAIRAQDLNSNFLQTLYSVQEIAFRSLSRFGGAMLGILSMSGFRIINVGDPVGLQDVATKNWVIGMAFAGVNLPDFQFDGGSANSTYGGTFLYIDGGNA